MKILETIQLHANYLYWFGWVYGISTTVGYLIAKSSLYITHHTMNPGPDI